MINIKIIDNTYEICKELNIWLQNKDIINHAMFDNTFDDELRYYQKEADIYPGKIKDFVKVVYINDILTGYLVLQYYGYIEKNKDIKEVSINPIIINPSLQNKGYGKLIVSYLIKNIDEVIGGKVNKITVSVFYNHKISMKLFKGLGFTEYGSSEDNDYIYLEFNR